MTDNLPTSRSQGRSRHANPRSAQIELPGGLKHCLDDFDRHLAHVVGLAPSSRRKYCYFVRRFLSQYGVPMAQLQQGPGAEWLTAFVRQEADHLHGHGRNNPGNALRAWLRYLVFCGTVSDGLKGAIPSYPQWKSASLPVHLTIKETERVLSAWHDGSPHELRNRAMLMLLARTGLRAREAIQLALDDINWTAGTIRIRPGKTRRERHLPLPRDVGEALCDYLQHERPISSCRAVFLSTRGPYGPIHDSSTVSITVRRAMMRAGVIGITAAAHALRYTAATQMVCGGASFKEIADVLGHASLATTAIYAKLDLATLARVALPWPGARS